MAKLSILEPIVKDILERYPKTREDDMLLYYMYIVRMIGRDFIENVFADAKFRKTFKISPYHSVARCRRKLQATYEHLKPSEKVRDARLNETSTYIDYAIDGYKSNFMEMIESFK